MAPAIFVGVCISLLIGAFALVISEAIFDSTSKVAHVMYIIDSVMLVIICIAIVGITIATALS